MILILQQLRVCLIANGASKAETDHVPVVKLFDPCGAATWLVTELMADGNTLFELADLGFGHPELGSLSLLELESIKGVFGLGIERDIHFRRALSALRIHRSRAPRRQYRRGGSRLAPRRCRARQASILRPRNSATGRKVRRRISRAIFFGATRLHSLSRQMRTEPVYHQAKHLKD
jgi:Protein of unknown function (DUF2958)